MDHLPTIKNAYPGSMIPSVPYLVAGFDFEYPIEPQGFRGFQEFPSLHGYDHESLAALALSDRRTGAFLQSWLFFGLLTETFSRPNYCFNREDFLCLSNTGEPEISTKALFRYLWYWQAARYTDDSEAMTALERTVDDCLRVAQSVLALVNSQMRQDMRVRNSLKGEHWSVEVASVFSLSLLGESLTWARRYLSQYTSPPDFEWDCAFLERRLLASGWCQGEISSFRKSCALSSRFYLSMMDRRVLGKSHNKCNSSVPCQAYQLDYSTYRTQHRPDCSDQVGCAEVGPAMADVTSAIGNGGSAVIATGLNSPGQGLSPQVIQVGGTGGSVIRYVAISHVWSDGLGNPWSNRLQLCQLRHIQNLVNALYTPDAWPVPFWIDTLGIPVGKKNAEFRRMAITRIAETFKKADNVLVIDNSLQRYPTDISWVETLMRIQYSPWMTRLWTLLEGRLAQGLYFQFQDKAISSEQLIELTVQRNLAKISETLLEWPEDKLLKSPSAMQLVRALGTAISSEIILLAALPPQTDPDMEELRKDAIERLEKDEYGDYHRLHATWEPFLRKHNLLYDLNDDDETVQVNLATFSSCPVTLHAFNSVTSFRVGAFALTLSNLKDMPDLAKIKAESSTSRIFEEVCYGFRARTTSRLDDESICLGAMLGADLEAIMKVASMHWRLREWLDKIDAKNSTNVRTRRLGINTRRFTEACHRRRMEVLLAQVPQFPASIIYWNAPRLETDRWKWAPRSVLYRNLDSGSVRVVGEHATLLMDQGLQITTRAWKLGARATQSIPKGNEVSLAHFTPCRG